ncbi:phosphatidylinositol 4,5-bisphosphate 3-kinase catalytic subunit beta isoform [Culicoides brevitarsis]|uniref:phosphatidylinositol 4,5-bisphosphate 3-kinase catalytic subunit beta isoform n=1 Tax=Culicoides brevitarsis TaxID=469753 RepID=UPI00307C22B5
MVPNVQTVNPYYNFDYWANQNPTPSENEQVELTIFMPNGILIVLNVPKTITLAELKEDVWEAAERMPLFGHLKDKSYYVLGMVTKYSSDEMHDETKRICDIQPYFCIFRVLSKQNATNNKLNKSINCLIGKSLNDIKIINNAEVNDFRHKMNLLTDDVSTKRHRMSLVEKLSYQYPLRLAATNEMPENVKKRMRNDHFVLVAKFHRDATSSFTFNVPYFITPSKMLEQVLAKKALTMNAKGEILTQDYILKVCGQDEYLFGDYPLVQFLYVQDTLSRGGVPTLVVKQVADVEIEESTYTSTKDLLRSSKQQSEKSTLRKKVRQMLSWDIDQPFKCKIQIIREVNISEDNRYSEIGIQVGLYHGGKALCEPQRTIEKPLTSQRSVRWDEELTFNINVLNLPRMTRLCFVVYETVKSAKYSGTKTRRLKDTNKDIYINPICWANTTVFDFKNQLKTGDITLYTWTFMDTVQDQQSEDLMHPLGTVEQNPRVYECASLTVGFHNYIEKTATIIYPNEETVLEYAESNRATKDLSRSSAQDTRNVKEILAPFMHNDRLNEMHENDRDLIWTSRNEVLANEPDGLPCLLHCVEWKNRDEVAEVTNLLLQWPKVSIERALELLDYAYAEPAVRRYAVDCLQTITDEELLLYLLQLVQAIKHESYLYCDLVEFLLKRALHNQRIGHFFFWHLRSEVPFPSVQIRFGLILEAYLMGSQEHISALLKQTECLDKLKQCSDIVKKGNKEKSRTLLQEFLQHGVNIEAISDVISPLNPSFRCRKLKIDKCKVMDSKMRPLWFVYENADMHGDDIYIIFKNGDDLRQDMFTIQMLRIMDRVWKSSGYDFRMIPYSCISMDRRQGMIEVVLNAETIANIQKERGTVTSSFKKGSLLMWLKEHNQTEEQLQKAIQEFTLSCAGYCVATYVLGVADRHSDNIMVKKTGQLFHIDFGHILGHFKEKFGFRRERVPFVLTHDFVYVINKGQTNNKGADEFRNFQELCETAFIILRRHGCLILSLFSMMISTGLPELSSEKDLNYLRETLVLDLTEEEAREHFKSKFSEALENSWKTSLNWFTHNISTNHNYK